MTSADTTAAAPIAMPTLEYAAGRNAAFHHDHVTLASPAAVWAEWMDVAGWGRWDAGLQAARCPAPLGPGVVGEIVPLRGPPARFAVGEFVPGVSYAFSTALPLAALTVRRAIIATAPTIIRHEVRFSGALGWLWAALLGPGFRRALPPTMARVAALAEARS